jgi:hypothetical protein
LPSSSAPAAIGSINASGNQALGNHTLGNQFNFHTIHPQLTDPRLAAVLGDMTGHKKQIAGAQKRKKSHHRRGQFWKRDVESVELFVYGHWSFL